jgi:hypothetical protein
MLLMLLGSLLVVAFLLALIACIVEIAVGQYRGRREIRARLSAERARQRHA